MELKKIETTIKKLKKKIYEIKAMRPGSISEQYNVCGKSGCRCKDKKNPEKHGPYFKLSYTHQGQQKTQFIRDDLAKNIEIELASYKEFKSLIQELLTLEIERSNLRMRLGNNKIKSKKLN